MSDSVSRLTHNCEKCDEKDRMIRVLHEQSERYRFDADYERRVRYHVQKIMRDIYDLSHKGMWYPSDREERPHVDGSSDQQKRWCDVQSKRPHMVPE